MLMGTVTFYVIWYDIPHVCFTARYTMCPLARCDNTKYLNIVSPFRCYIDNHHGQGSHVVIKLRKAIFKINKA